MKLVKFRDYLVPLVLSGEKNSTWRLLDDKNLSVDNEIALQEFGRDSSFATAKITKVVEKPFSELTQEDKRATKLSLTMRTCTERTAAITIHR